MVKGREGFSPAGVQGIVRGGRQGTAAAEAGPVNEKYLTVLVL